MMTLLRKTIQGYISLLVAMMLLLFVPAGTLYYWQGWLYMAVFMLCGVWVTIDLWQHDKVLLERRLRAGPGAEQEPSQKIIMRIVILVFLLMMIVPALSYRYMGSQVPIVGVIAGNIALAFSFYAILRVFRENSYSAATVQVAPDQTVISTGPYAWVRHPMYSGSIVMFAVTPLALGSYWGLLVLIPFVLVLIWRLCDEERFLSHQLPGYTDYMKQVRYRLIPFVW